MLFFLIKHLFILKNHLTLHPSQKIHEIHASTMKYYLSIILLFSFILNHTHSMDEKQIKGYNTLYEKAQQWTKYIHEQEAYATDIPGFFDEALNAQKTRILNDLTAIRERIEKIA